MHDFNNKESFMEIAIKEAKKANLNGEIPVGAVLVDKNGRVLVSSGNNCRNSNDPTAHAEMEVIRLASRMLGNSRLLDCDLYVTLEPCPMCAQAISFARIKRLYYGASDSKGGGVEHGPLIFSQPTCKHSPEIYSGINETQSSELLKDFFIKRRL